MSNNPFKSDAFNQAITALNSDSSKEASLLRNTKAKSLALQAEKRLRDEELRQEREQHTRDTVDALASRNPFAGLIGDGDGYSPDIGERMSILGGNLRDVADFGLQSVGSAIEGAGALTLGLAELGGKNFGKDWDIDFISDAGKAIRDLSTEHIATNVKRARSAVDMRDLDTAVATSRHSAGFEGIEEGSLGDLWAGFGGGVDSLFSKPGMVVEQFGPDLIGSVATASAIGKAAGGIYKAATGYEKKIEDLASSVKIAEEAGDKAKAGELIKQITALRDARNKVINVASAIEGVGGSDVVRSANSAFDQIADNTWDDLKDKVRPEIREELDKKYGTDDEAKVLELAQRAALIATGIGAGTAAVSALFRGAELEQGLGTAAGKLKKKLKGESTQPNVPMEAAAPAPSASRKVTKEPKAYDEGFVKEQGKLVKNLAKTIGRLSRETVTEAIEEGGATYAEEKALKSTIDPERDTIQETAKSASIGAAVGGGFDLVGAGVRGAKALKADKRKVSRESDSKRGSTKELEGEAIKVYEDLSKAVKDTEVAEIAKLQEQYNKAAEDPDTSPEELEDIEGAIADLSGRASKSKEAVDTVTLTDMALASVSADQARTFRKKNSPYTKKNFYDDLELVKTVNQAAVEEAEENGTAPKLDYSRGIALYDAVVNREGSERPNLDAKQSEKDAYVKEIQEASVMTTLHEADLQAIVEDTTVNEKVRAQAKRALREHIQERKRLDALAKARIGVNKDVDNQVTKAVNVLSKEDASEAEVAQALQTLTFFSDPESDKMSINFRNNTPPSDTSKSESTSSGQFEFNFKGNPPSTSQDTGDVTVESIPEGLSNFDEATQKAFNSITDKNAKLVLGAIMAQQANSGGSFDAIWGRVDHITRLLESINENTKQGGHGKSTGSPTRLGVDARNRIAKDLTNAQQIANNANNTAGNKQKPSNTDSKGTPTKQGKRPAEPSQPKSTSTQDYAELHREDVAVAERNKSTLYKDSSNPSGEIDTLVMSAREAAKARNIPAWEVLLRRLKAINLEREKRAKREAKEAPQGAAEKAYATKLKASDAKLQKDYDALYEAFVKVAGRPPEGTYRPDPNTLKSPTGTSLTDSEIESDPNRRQWFRKAQQLELDEEYQGLLDPEELEEYKRLRARVTDKNVSPALAKKYQTRLDSYIRKITKAYDKRNSAEIEKKISDLQSVPYQYTQEEEDQIKQHRKALRKAEESLESVNDDLAEVAFDETDPKYSVLLEDKAKLEKTIESINKELNILRDAEKARRTRIYDDNQQMLVALNLGKTSITDTSTIVPADTTDPEEIAKLEDQKAAVERELDKLIPNLRTLKKQNKEKYNRLMKLIKGAIFAKPNPSGDLTDPINHRALTNTALTAAILQMSDALYYLSAGLPLHGYAPGFYSGSTVYQEGHVNSNKFIGGSPDYFMFRLAEITGQPFYVQKRTAVGNGFLYYIDYNTPITYSKHTSNPAFMDLGRNLNDFVNENKELFQKDSNSLSSRIKRNRSFRGYITKFLKFKKDVEEDVNNTLVQVPDALLHLAPLYHEIRATLSIRAGETEFTLSNELIDKVIKTVADRNQIKNPLLLDLLSDPASARQLVRILPTLIQMDQKIRNNIKLKADEYASDSILSFLGESTIADTVEGNNLLDEDTVNSKRRLAARPFNHHKMPSEMRLAAALAGIKWITDSGKSTLKPNIHNIAMMLGIKSDDAGQIDSAAIKTFREHGDYANGHRSGMGRTMMELLGMEVVSNAPFNFGNTAVEAFGLVVEKALANSGLIKVKDVSKKDLPGLFPPPSDYASQVEKNLWEKEKNEKVKFIRLTSDKEKDKDGKEVDKTVPIYDQNTGKVVVYNGVEQRTVAPSERVDNLISSITGKPLSGSKPVTDSDGKVIDNTISSEDRILSKLTNGSIRTIDLPWFEPPVEGTSGKPASATDEAELIADGTEDDSLDGEIPGRQREALKIHRRRPHSIPSKLYNLFKVLSKQAFLEMNGYFDEDDFKGVSSKTAESRRAINEHLLNDYENLAYLIKEIDRRVEEHNANVGTDGTSITPSDVKFYFDHKVTNNMRMLITGSKFNPLSSKMQRYMIQMDGYETEVDTPAKRLHYKLAILEAFGKKVDVNSIDQSLKDFDELLEDSEIMGIVEAIQEALNSNTDLPTETYKAMAKMGKKEEPAMMFRAFVELGNYDPNGSFTTTMPRQIDGITNGTAIGLVLLSKAITTEEDYIQRIKVMQKVGIGKGTAVDYFNAPDREDGAKNLDVYQTGAMEYAKHQKVMVSTIFEEGREYDAQISGAESKEKPAIKTMFARQLKKKFEEKGIPVDDSFVKTLVNLYDKGKGSKIKAILGTLPENLEVTDDGKYVTVSSGSRKIFKYPVMYSGYGAGVHSISEGIAYNQLDSIYDQLAELHHLYHTTQDKAEALAIKKEFGKIIRTLDEVATYQKKVKKKVEKTSKNGNTRTVTETEFTPFAPSTEFLERFNRDKEGKKIEPENVEDIINSSTLDYIISDRHAKEYVRNTTSLLKPSLDAAFSALVPTISEGRKNLTTASTVAFTIFNTIFKDRLQTALNNKQQQVRMDIAKHAKLYAAMEEYKGLSFDAIVEKQMDKTMLTLDEEREIFNSIRDKAPLVRSVVNSLDANVSFDEYLVLLKKVKTRSAPQVNFMSPDKGVQRDLNVTKVYGHAYNERSRPTTDSARPKRNELAAPGVSGLVRGIQSGDAAIMAATMMDTLVFNVHDAIIVGIGDADEAARTMNKNFIETLTAFNMIREYADMLTRVVGGLKEVEGGELGQRIRFNLAQLTGWDKTTPIALSFDKNNKGGASITAENTTESWYVQRSRAIRKAKSGENTLNEDGSYNIDLSVVPRERPYLTSIDFEGFDDSDFVQELGEYIEKPESERAEDLSDFPKIEEHLLKLLNQQVANQDAFIERFNEEADKVGGIMISQYNGASPNSGYIYRGTKETFTVNVTNELTTKEAVEKEIGEILETGKTDSIETRKEKNKADLLSRIAMFHKAIGGIALSNDVLLDRLTRFLSGEISFESIGISVDEFLGIIKPLGKSSLYKASRARDPKSGEVTYTLNLSQMIAHPNARTHMINFLTELFQTPVGTTEIKPNQFKWFNPDKAPLEPRVNFTAIQGSPDAKTVTPNDPAMSSNPENRETVQSSKFSLEPKKGELALTNDNSEEPAFKKLWFTEDNVVEFLTENNLSQEEGVALTEAADVLINSKYLTAPVRNSIINGAVATGSPFTNKKFEEQFKRVFKDLIKVTKDPAKARKYLDKYLRTFIEDGRYDNHPPKVFKSDPVYPDSDVTNTLSSTSTVTDGKSMIAFLEHYINQSGLSKEHGDNLRRIVENIIVHAVDNFDIEEIIDAAVDGAKGQIEFNPDGTIKLKVKIGKSSSGIGLSKSSAEVYVHELLHAVIEYGLETNPQLFTELQELQRAFKDGLDTKAEELGIAPHMLFVTSSNPSEAEIREAFAQYNYLFIDSPSNIGSSAKEFMIYGLTNPKTMALAEEITPKPAKDTIKNSVLSGLRRIFHVITRMISTHSRDIGSNPDVAARLYNLATKLGGVNNYHAERLERAGSMFDNAMYEIDKRLSDVLKSVTVPIERLTSHYDPKSNRGTFFRGIVQKDKALVAKAITQTAERVGFARNGLVNGIIREIMGVNQSESLKGYVNLLRRGKKFIENASLKTANSSAKVLKAAFSTEPTKEEEQALFWAMKAELTALFDTNVAGLVDVESITDIHEFLADDNKINSYIDHIESSISTKEYNVWANYYKAAARSLASYQILGAHTIRNGPVNSLNIIELAAFGGTKFAENKAQTGDLSALYHKVEALATLHAIKFMDKKHRDTLMNLIEKEEAKEDGAPNGVNVFLGAHAAYIDDAADRLDLAERQRMRGYTKLITDDMIDFQIVEETDLAHMQMLGFEKFEVTDDSGIVQPLPPGKALVVHRHGHMRRRVSGAFSLVSSTKAGKYKEWDNNEADIVINKGGVGFDASFGSMAKPNPEKTQAQRNKEQYRREATRALYVQTLSNDFTSDPISPEESVLLPIFKQEDPSIYTYRIMHTQNFRDQVLSQDTRGIHVLSQMFGSIVTKAEVNDQNVLVNDLLYQDFVEGYADNPEDFINITELYRVEREKRESGDYDYKLSYKPGALESLSRSDKEIAKKFFESFQLLPPPARVDLINKFTQKEATNIYYGLNFVNRNDGSTKNKEKRQEVPINIIVRKDAMDVLFGNRYSSITDLYNSDTPLGKVYTRTLNTLAKIFSPKWANNGQILRAGNTWDELVSIAKDNIVIKSLATLADNVFSNIMLLRMKGVSYADIWRGFRASISSLDTYNTEYEQLIEKQHALYAGISPNPQKTEHEIKMLTSRLRANPMHELVEAGAFQTLVEGTQDSATEYAYPSTLERIFNPVIGGVPQHIKEAGNFLFMTHTTGIYQTMRQVTQMSDFWARYTLHEHNKKHRKISFEDSFEDIMSTFIEYDIPMNESLAYIDRKNFLGFAKYLLRVQRVIFDTFAERPASNLARVLLADSLDIPNIVNSTLSYNYLETRLQFHPLSIFGDIVSLPVAGVTEDAVKLSTPL